MRTPRFFCDQPITTGSILRLDGPPAHHLKQVLRRGVGDPVRLFNGQGGEFSALISSSSRHSVDLSILEFFPADREPRLQTHLGLALSKGDRMDWAVQKSTELGVSSITPLLSEHCDVRLPHDRQQKKREHWLRIARSACEQCGRNRVPAIEPIVRLTEWVTQQKVDLALDCDSQGAAIGPNGIAASAAAPCSLALLVGPEGGLSEEEILLSCNSGFRQTRLGPRTLRTETAPLAMLSIAQALWGDLAV